ncbi:MAG TPA: hypothetical protein VN030_11505 [Cellvibrio sp.]|nr:hypothetical protein [Cellvibrio sp.]
MSISQIAVGLQPLGFVTDISESVTANAGDALLYCLNWRDGSNAITLNTPAWGSEAFTKIGGTIYNESSYTAIYKLNVAASGAHNITATFSDYVRVTTMKYHARPSDANPIYFSGFLSKAYPPASFTEPSLSFSSVPADAILLDILAASGFDSGDNEVGTTWTPDSPATLVDSVINTNSGHIANMLVSKTLGGGNITSAWSASADEPRYAQLGIYLSQATPVSIDTLASTLMPGVSTPVATTGLGTITGGTFGGEPINFSAPGGDGTLSPLAWVDGLVQPLSVGFSYTVSLTDGDKTATRGAIYGMPAGLAHRTVPGTVSTADDSLYKEPLLAPGTDVFIPDWMDSLMDSDGTLRDVPFGTHDGFWLRDLSYTLHSFSIVVNETGVSVEFARVIIGTKAAGRLLAGKFLSGKLL